MDDGLDERFRSISAGARGLQMAQITRVCCSKAGVPFVARESSSDLVVRLFGSVEVSTVGRVLGMDVLGWGGVCFDESSSRDEPLHGSYGLRRRPFRCQGLPWLHRPVIASARPMPGAGWTRGLRGLAGQGGAPN